MNEHEILDENEFRNVLDDCWDFHWNEIRLIAKI